VQRVQTIAQENNMHEGLFDEEEAFASSLGSPWQPKEPFTAEPD
jgi:hypothetical protein